MNKHATIEELLGAVFSKRCVLTLYDKDTSQIDNVAEI
jgi:hypothetical protein